MITFRSLDEAKAYILGKMRTAVGLVEERVYIIINRFVKQYYAEWSPSVYERTYQLYSALKKSGVYGAGNGFGADVFLDEGSLDYGVKNLHGNPVTGGYRHPFIRHGWVVSPTGQFTHPTGNAGMVLEAAAHGSHGGYKPGVAIWDEPVAILQSQYMSLFKKAFHDAGLPVK